jgi:26S proteasome regulatory subunit N6
LRVCVFVCVLCSHKTTKMVVSSSFLEDAKAKLQLGKDLEKKTSLQEAIETYRAVIFSSSGAAEDDDEKKRKKTATEINEETKIKESAIDRLSHVYAKNNDANAIKLLVDELKPLFEQMPKAKTAKIVRNLIDVFASLEGFDELQVDLCKEQIAWSKKEKRTFLRHRVELRLAALYLKSRRYTDSLKMISSLAREVKKLDDKLLLVDIHLLESKIHYALNDLAKAKAALTASRTNAGSIYVPPSAQCGIDLQSGILHAEEKDYKTGYSYFFEAFEQLTNLDDATYKKETVVALKYMLMCKIMSGNAGDVKTLVASKSGLKFAGEESLDAMKAVAEAYISRSLKDLERVLRDYREFLDNDPIVANHLGKLKDDLMEQNLFRLIEPYSRVEIARIAELIELPTLAVESKLSQMILDGKFEGILDQGSGCLVVFDEQPPETMYKATLETIGNMTQVVEKLQKRSEGIILGQ